MELHLHTVMSDNDSVVQIKDVVKRAHDWGHPALAITDHGVLQAFPIARHAYEDLHLAEDDPFKIIYGVEGYFVDDLGDLAIDSRGQTLDQEYVVLILRRQDLTVRMTASLKLEQLRLFMVRLQRHSVNS